MVDALVHERAAVHGPGAVPIIFVIGLGTKPAHSGIAQVEFAQSAVVDQVAHLLHGVVVAILQDDAQFEISARAPCDHAVGVFRC